MRCIFALSHHGDLIALLGKLHVHIQPHHQRQNDQNGQQVAVGADGRQPSLLALAVDQAHMIGAAGVFPKHDGEGHQLHGDIVEHQGKQGFQCALKNAGITPQIRPAATPATGQSAYIAQEGRFFP